jgi:hypothetical protein
MNYKLGRKKKGRSMSDQSWLSLHSGKKEKENWLATFKGNNLPLYKIFKNTQWKHSNLLLMMQQCVTFTSSNGQNILATQV